jgi:hypothetical protein
MHTAHRKAAEQHELAAQAHRSAAEHNEKGALPRRTGTRNERWSTQITRGCPQGSPEEDWFRATHELRARKEGLPPA